MNHCAHVTSMRVRDHVLQLTLRSGSHDIAVRAPLVVVDLCGPAPCFRLRVGSLDRCREVPVSANDTVLVLSANRLPVEVVTPAIPEDWDDALARLVAEEA